MSVKVSCVEADRVDIPIMEYNDLVRASEKIAAVERVVAAGGFVSTEDIYSILGIERKENKNEQS